MAKRVSKGQKRPFSSNGKAAKVNENQVLYTSALNTTIIFLPMPPMLMEKIEIGLKKTWPKPEVPTYEMQTAVGTVEVKPHNETTLETDEERAAWSAYQVDLAAWEEEKNRRLLRAIQLQCIQPVDIDNEEWVERQKFLGMDIPTNPFERKLHYIETEVIGDERDIMACMTIPMQLVSGASEEDMAAAEALFRDAVQKETIRQRAAQGEG